MQLSLTALCTYAYMFANWGKYRRHSNCADADLLPQINNATDAAGSPHPAAFVGHREYFNLYTHEETLMLLALHCG